MPLRPLILRYLAVMLLCIVFLIVVDLLVLHYFGVETSNGTTILTTIVPAMDAGQVFARRTGRAPTTSESWRITVALWFSAFVASFALAGALVFATGVEIAPLVDVLGLRMIVTVVVLVGVLLLLLTRWFFGIGARGILRRQQKVAVRDMQ
jgi:hypothetical protein